MKYIVDIDDIELNENDIYTPQSYPHGGLFMVTVEGTTMGKDKRKEIVFASGGVCYNMSAGNTNVDRFFKPMEETLNATEKAPVEDAEEEPKWNGDKLHHHIAEEAFQISPEYLLRLVDIMTNGRAYKET